MPNVVEQEGVLELLAELVADLLGVLRRRGALDDFGRLVIASNGQVVPLAVVFYRSHRHLEHWLQRNTLRIQIKTAEEKFHSPGGKEEYTRIYKFPSRCRSPSVKHH